MEILRINYHIEYRTYDLSNRKSNELQILSKNHLRD